MNSRRQARMEHFFAEETSRFLIGERVRGVFVTVTRAELLKEAGGLIVFVTVLPENKEKGVFEKLKKSAGRLRAYLSNALQGRAVPEIKFEIDIGEKNRAKIDDLIAESRSS